MHVHIINHFAFYIQTELHVNAKVLWQLIEWKLKESRV